MKLLREIIGNLIEFVAAVGALAMFFGRLLGQVPAALLRVGVVVHQVHNAGALSLVIIMICGLFVGMVLGVQGYELLQRFGSEDALGTGAGLGTCSGCQTSATNLHACGAGGVCALDAGEGCRVELVNSDGGVTPPAETSDVRTFT